VVSDGLDTPLTGRNRLQWVNPPTSPIVVRIKWNKSAGTCTYPDPMSENATADFSEDLSCTVTCPNAQPYGGLVLDESYCHTVYLGYAGNTWSQGAKALGRPFDASPGQSVKWKYFVGEGVATLAAPTIGSHGVLVPSNDFRVHSMARGALGGTWPVAPDWTPVNLGSPAQTRSPIVDIGGVPRMYLTTLDGWVHAIDARTGVKMWETQIGTTAWSGGGAAPAGIFTAFGGAWDYILVGTRQGSGNRFYALNPDTGAVIDYYPKAGELPVGAVEMGAVTAMASVDYARKQVYFATFAGPTHSLWCLRLGPPSNALQLGWAHQKVDNTPSAGIPGLGEIDGSPVLRPDGTRLYVGNTSGRLWSIDPVNGTILSSFDAAPGGNVNGFPYPDRRNRDVYFVTTASFPGDNIWAVTDSVTTGLGLKWKTTASNPSTPLVSTVTDSLYVGSNLVGPGGGVREYALTDGTNTNSVQLTPGPMVIGAPSLDTQALPKSLLHVGSVDGVFYAVEVPF
jgi:outer membrane protein assembly factor BamB